LGAAAVHNNKHGENGAYQCRSWLSKEEGESLHIVNDSMSRPKTNDEIEKIGRKLLRAIKSENMAMLLQSIYESADVSISDLMQPVVSPVGHTPLCSAVAAAKAKAVWLLLVFGHNVNECSYDGDFPLTFASKRGCDGRVLKLLVSHRDIQINQQNKNGETALWLAASSGNVKVCWHANNRFCCTTQIYRKTERVHPK
jgi:hypothetical protein